MTQVGHVHNEPHDNQRWMCQLRPSEIETWWQRVDMHATTAHKDKTLADIIEERTL
jgi:hypothetical protein